ncbi:MAG: peptidylprolyl isomerase [Deltaproteobacteria bacterium]|nr:peptidylprolyl isomerase [Deltaproteobacteria bacterium]
MLQVFRRHSYSWGTRVLLLLLGGVFALFFGSWGAASYFTRVRPAAEVGCYSFLHLFTMPGCHTITPEQLDSASVDLRREIQNMYDAQAPQMLQAVNLRQMALEQLIDQNLINREAARLGLRISDDELARTIASQTAFQVDGHFNVQKYDQILRENDLEPSAFESKTRDRILSDTVRQMIAQAVQVSQDEARNEFNRFGEKLSLAYIEFPYTQFSGNVNPSKRELIGYYNDNRDQFREPERIRIEFIRYDPQVLGASQTPSTEDIQANYERNLNTQFTHPEQVRARHILIAVSADASPPETAMARAKAEEVMQKVKSGGDFAKLAREYSDDPGTKDRGGELGYISRGEMVKPFEDAAFKLTPGQLTLVKSRYGYHVLQLEEIKKASQETLERAKPKVIAAIKQQMGSDLARQDVEQDLAAALEGRDLKGIAQKRSLIAVETTPLSAQDSIKGAESDPKLLAEAFKLGKGDIRAITGTSVPFLVKLVDRTPEQIPPFAKIQDKVRAAYVRQKAALLAGAAAQKLLKQIKSAADFNSAAAVNHLQVRTTGEFPRAERRIPGIGPFPEATEAAATLPNLPATLDRVMENGGNSYIVEVLARKLPTDQEWKTEGPAFIQQMLQQRRATAWINFINHLKVATPISINTDLVGQSSSPSPM